MLQRSLITYIYWCFKTLVVPEEKITGESIHKKLLWTETQPRKRKKLTYTCVYHKMLGTVRQKCCWPHKKFNWRQNSHSPYKIFGTLRQIALHLTISLALWDKIEIFFTKFLALKTNFSILRQNFRRSATKLWSPPNRFFKIFGTLEKLCISELWIFAKMVLDVAVNLYTVFLMAYSKL